MAQIAEIISRNSQRGGPGARLLDLRANRVAVAVPDLAGLGSLPDFDQFVTRRNHSDIWLCGNQDRRIAVSRQHAEIRQPNAPARSQNQFTLTRFSAAP